MTEADNARYGRFGRIRLTALFLVLILIPSTAAGLDSVFFTARPLVDTVLTHGSMYLEIALTNASSEPMYCRPFAPAHGYIEIVWTNLDTGERPMMCGLAVDYVFDSNKMSQLQPGDTKSDLLNLLYTSCLRDDGLGLPYWPAGRYQVVLTYTYDPWQRAMNGGSATLSDTVKIVVNEDKGVDLEALNALKRGKTLQHERNRDAAMLAYWNVVRSYPGSPYADRACEEMLGMLTLGRALPQDVPRSEVLLEIIKGAAYRDWVARLVDEYAAITPSDKAKSSLEAVITLRPKSVAARRARQLLEKGLQ